MENSNKKILILSSNHPICKEFYNNIPYSDRVEVFTIIEKPISKFGLLVKRYRKIGLFQTINQLAFFLILLPIIKICSKQRVEDLKKRIIKESIMPNERFYVDNINSEHTLKLIRKIKPHRIFCFGTRLLSPYFISQVGMPIFNIHFGITKRYRGSHGVYWALVNNDVQNCGLTIHYIDSGIDTGKIIKTYSLKISENDNFVSYVYLQLATLLLNIHEIFDLMVVDTSGCNGKKGKLFGHPTFSQYLYNYFTKNIK